MSESEDVRIKIPNKSTDVDNISWEWEEYHRCGEITEHYERKRHMEKVPPLLMEGEKGKRNREYYKPAVVSFGPYHHNRNELAQAEKYKLITLEEYRLSIGTTMGVLYNKVFEVVHNARECYIDGSTNDYNDEEFTQMMLQDGCFLLFYIDSYLWTENTKAWLYHEYLGALGYENIIRDIFLLENQIPFVVLQVLLDLRFPDDRGEKMLNNFFNHINYGVLKTRVEKVLGKKQIPLHLLDLYRSYFISFSGSIRIGSANYIQLRKWSIGMDEEEEYNYAKQNRSLASVMELKAKGIFLKCTYYESLGQDIKFRAHFCYGELEVVRRWVSPFTKALYMNMIAYEMCPHNPNDFRVSTYVNIMKSLVSHPNDVKELQNSGVMIHSLGRDDQVVKMYADIDAPVINFYVITLLRRDIWKHWHNKYKTWSAELINVYFSSPWKTVALLVATAILFVTFLQTYFTIWPLPDGPS